MSEGNFYAGRVYQRSSKDTGQLEKNANEYPFSALANFLLLYHYKKTNNPSFEIFAKKSVLHFSNPYWLQLLLHEDFEQQNDSLTDNLQISQPSSKLTDVTSIEVSPVQKISKQDIAEKLCKEDAHHIQYKEDEAIKSDNKQNNSNEFFKENKVGSNNKQVHETLSIASSEKETIKISENAIAFDPFHTVDYFASQGIHLNEEELATNDKLGSQMKSFTAWLKSMKKLHPAKLSEQSMATEQIVQAAAEESNLNADVLTEAMAEVLIKQNKKEKAIDMYNKLSFINPSKSAYFAAKIESIKQL